MKLVVGMVGENGAGKSTFAKSLIDLLGSKNCKIVKSSDILIETLNLWGIPSTRINLQKLAQAMVEIKPGALTDAVRNRIKTIHADVVIFDGVRWFSDEDLIRSYSRNLLVYVTASPEVRFNRLKNRNEKIGENNLTRERFALEEKMPTELQVPEIGSRADITINNDVLGELLQDKINQFYKQITTALQK